MASIKPVGMRSWVRSAATASVVAMAVGGGLLATAAPAAAHGPETSSDSAGGDGSAGEEPGGSGGAEDSGEAEDSDDAEDSGSLSEAELEAPTDEEFEELQEQIDELRDSASQASRHHESLRRLEASQRAELLLVGERLQRERSNLATLRTLIGQQASSQYRAGGGASLARLVLSETPEDFLNGASLIGRGELSARQLMERSEQSEESLRRDERRAAQLRSSTTVLVERQEELREGIEEKLEEAEEQFAELEEAKAAAEAAAAAAEEAEREAEREASREAADTVAEDGECAVAVRDSEKLAEPAVEEEWTAPLREYELSAGYGSSGHRWSNGHTGQDFAVETGTPVLVIGSGTVVATGCSDAFGHQVVVEHENGYYSQYAHLSVIEVEPGQEVGAGRRIGLAGNTGNSSGPHLHFEIRLTPYIGSAVDPMTWMSDHGVQL